ncbi:MAG: TlpA disulfide reductase family protein [Isosphaeraceae bacterium]|nr:TlpA disulfide reductase family protein [Isosphaeraceae bacterium]
MTSRIVVFLALLVVVPSSAWADGPPKNVAELQSSHDRALLRDLAAYIAANPKADDLDQAYMALFDKVIEHDWFSDHEAIAQEYLAKFPDGPVASLARIIGTMSRAQAGRFDEALTRFKELMASLGKTEQEEFAANFADSLASASTAAGEYNVSRQVYEALLARYGDSPTLRQKVRDELVRLELIGKPAPGAAVTDVKGSTIRLSDLRGKYVLVDFWATWCAPCVAELPRLQAAYAKYRDAGFEIVGISLDESKGALTDFVKARKIPWRQVHNASSGGDLVEAFGVKSIPATFLIDPQGVITRLELRGPVLDQALAKLLRDATVRRTSR